MHPASRITVLTAPLIAGLMLSACASAASDQAGLRDDHRAFMDMMVDRHGFTHDELEPLFAGLQPREDIIEAITRPAEALPWHRYRRIFLTDARADGGVEFWAEHERTIERAAREFSVAPGIIVAIIGVESNYGLVQGRYGVIEALATLGFDYPPRASFFRGELEQFLLLSREEGIDPREARGSYAGAMGSPQFISSSYRAYAVDFDDSGHRDLWNSWADIIGSVANYFHRHRWRRGEPVAVPATLTGQDAAGLATRGLDMNTTVGELRAAGVVFDEALDDDAAANLLELELDDGGTEHWVTLHNFHVITRYNRSSLYAMAVHLLSRDIAARRGAG